MYINYCRLSIDVYKIRLDSVRPRNKNPGQVKSGGAHPAGCVTVPTAAWDESGIVNVARGADQLKMHAARFSINFGSYAA